MEGKDLGKTSIGMQANVAAGLSYAFGWISGLIFYLIEKDNKYVRFNAMQSIVTFGALNLMWIIFTIIPVVGWVLLPVVGIVNIILWIILMVKGFTGQTFKVPFAGDIAEKHS